MATPRLVQIKTDDDGGDAASEGSRQTELAVEGPLGAWKMEVAVVYKMITIDN